MTDPGRATSPRPNRRETARGERGRKNVRSQSKLQLLLGVLICLAVIASVVMVFTDSVPMLRIGVVAALWAAVIGAIAMTKYRKDSENDAAKTRDLKLVYELQLEREIAARREYELVVETQVRRQVEEQVRVESTEELVGLREEMAALRSSLEALFDGELPDERTAVRAESHRLQELAGAPGRLIAAQAAELPPIEDVAVAPEEDDESFEPDYEGYRQAAQSVVPGAAEEDDPQTAETQILSAEEIAAHGQLAAEYLASADLADGAGGQGQSVQSFTLQGFAVQGYTTDGTTAESFTAEGFSAQAYGLVGGAMEEAEQDYAVEEFSAEQHSAEAAVAEDLAGEGFAAEDFGVDDSAGYDTAGYVSADYAPADYAPAGYDPADYDPADYVSADDDAAVDSDAGGADEAAGDSEHSVRVGGRSVADLMARLEANGTLPDSVVGRRRRRVED